MEEHREIYCCIGRIYFKNDELPTACFSIFSFESLQTRFGATLKCLPVDETFLPFFSYHATTLSFSHGSTTSFYFAQNPETSSLQLKRELKFNVITSTKIVNWQRTGEARQLVVFCFTSTLLAAARDLAVKARLHSD